MTKRTRSTTGGAATPEKASRTSGAPTSATSRSGVSTSQETPLAVDTSNLDAGSEPIFAALVSEKQHAGEPASEEPAEAGATDTDRRAG
ncbi:MAG: hypothetical protein ACRDPH_12145 [Marmoricola sp.]